MPNRALVGTLTIANGQQESNILSHRGLSNARQIIIAGPNTLPETITLYAAPLTTSTFADLNPVSFNGGAAVSFTGENNLILDAGGFESVGVRAGVAAGGARAFTLWAVF